MDAQQEEHELPVNRTPEFLKEVFTLSVQFVQAYGWFLVLGLVALLYLRSRFSNSLNRLTSMVARNTDEHKCDNDVAFKRQEAIEAARRRLQEQMDAQAARYAEEMKKKEEEKRAQKLEDWERHQQGKGYRSKYRPPEETEPASPSTSTTRKKKSSLRPAGGPSSEHFNPLMGAGSGSGYRPERRSLGGRGGG